MPEFDRTTPWPGTSLAMVVFRRQFTEINDQYWGPLPAELLVARFARQKGLSTDLKSALKVSGQDWQRVGHNVERFVNKFEMSRNWDRLLTLVLLTSAIELFFRNITRAAQLSDPTRVPGFPKTLDGLVLLKNNVSLDTNPNRFVQGEWTQRVTAYQKTFCGAPDILINSIAELDKMRRLRNKIAHDFGLNIDSHPYKFLSGSEAERVSQNRLKKWLGVVNLVVTAVDTHLSNEFVGDFETLELLHMWEIDKRALMRTMGIELSDNALSSARPFLKFLASATQMTPPGKQYWEGLNGFYNRI